MTKKGGMQFPPFLIGRGRVPALAGFIAENLLSLMQFML
jgi:hypothetical protein